MEEGVRGDGVGEDVCAVCRGAATAYRVIPCGHKVLCEVCGDHGVFFDEGLRPFSGCPVCGGEVEEPYFVRAETLERYRVFYP